MSISSTVSTVIAVSAFNAAIINTTVLPTDDRRDWASGRAGAGLYGSMNNSAPGIFAFRRMNLWSLSER